MILSDRINNQNRNKIIIFIIIIVLIIGIVFGVRKVHDHFSHEAAIREEENDPQLQAEREQQTRERRFMKTISGPAIRAYRRNYQVLPSVVIAQAIVESNWGTSKLYQVANNPFGIKGKYHGHSVSYETTEYANHRKATISAVFRKYPSLGAAINDHDQALSRGFIHRNHVMSYITDAKLLQKNHYATDPNYAEKLINIIRQYHLGKYDLQALNGRTWD